MKVSDTTRYDGDHVESETKAHTFERGGELAVVKFPHSKNVVETSIQTNKAGKKRAHLICGSESDFSHQTLLFEEGSTGICQIRPKVSQNLDVKRKLRGGGKGAFFAFDLSLVLFVFGVSSNGGIPQFCFLSRESSASRNAASNSA